MRQPRATTITTTLSHRRLTHSASPIAKPSNVTEREGVAPLPVLGAAGTDRLIEPMAFAVTTILLSDGSETAGLAVLVNRVGNPVNAGIAADGLVEGVDEDDLIELVGRVLVDPVRV
ncbi:LOW QUALITY PROTEIN: hypothetical protein BC936DRAFT_139118 [Jimgerdemannia flammicorona]|uniref:Uncharacterized protein n=1 Tax=Jimgerdemannia flammicorona TaxID=994334 RepID=A0A433BAM1_9FUNG|nr:LOW QUALITY PROTEIN: hypothetical protein BC936DRAFT_139118 [Jimgerdemannia flammicorona]